MLLVIRRPAVSPGLGAAGVWAGGGGAVSAHVRRLADRTIKAELGAVVGQHGVEVVGIRAWARAWTGWRTSIGRVAPGRPAPRRMLVRFSWSDSIASATDARASSIASAAASRALYDATTSFATWAWTRARSMSAVLRSACAAADVAAVGEAEAPQLPEEAHRRVAPCIEVAEEIHSGRPEPAARVGHGQRRDERTELCLLEPQHRRLRQLACSPELRPVHPALADQVVERSVVGDQSDDCLGRLDRRDHDVRVEQERTDQVAEATSSSPTAARMDRCRLRSSVRMRRWSASSPAPDRA